MTGPSLSRTQVPLLLPRRIGCQKASNLFWQPSLATCVLLRDEPTARR